MRRIKTDTSTHFRQPAPQFTFAITEFEVQGANMPLNLVGFGLLLLCLVLLLRQRNRPGPRIVVSEIPMVCLHRHTSLGHLFAQVLFALFTLRFIYFLLQPTFDADIFEEYRNSPGGLGGAWVIIFFIFYAPCVLLYVWIAFYCVKGDHKENKVGNP